MYRERMTLHKDKERGDCEADYLSFKGLWLHG